jgi:hypothetical protein
LPRGRHELLSQEEGRESVRDIAKMCRPLMVWDLLKGISPTSRSTSPSAA